MGSHPGKTKGLRNGKKIWKWVRFLPFAVGNSA